jgi:hypothetical protein
MQLQSAKCMGLRLAQDDETVWMTKRFAQPNYFSKKNREAGILAASRKKRLRGRTNASAPT